MKKRNSEIRIGYQLGKLTVVADTGERKAGYVVWNCQCGCGRQIRLDTRALQRQTIRDCGCETKVKPGQKDLTGQRFGRLVAVEATEMRGQGGATIWRCRCDCGREAMVPSSQLLKGARKSCGCLSRPENVKMSSGQISECFAGGNANNSAYGGGGVCVEYGSFELAGSASINGCTATFGAAVYVRPGASSFLMSGGVIENNQTSYEGTVYSKGNFQMTGGTIQLNTANYGGAVTVTAGRTVLNGGVISKNQASNRGGGIYQYNGTLQLRNVTISENKTLAALSQDSLINGSGGGIYQSGGIMNIYDGTQIQKNEARRGGGIYQYAGTIKMNGGTITRNTADMGGGIAQYPRAAGECTLAGGMVYENTSVLSASGNDIYSWYEGTDEYPGMDVKNVPSMTLIPASGMKHSDYNVWKDDTYSGTVRVAAVIGEGQMITGSISRSINLQLTAAWYENAVADEDETSMQVESILIKKKTETDTENPDGIQDGSSNWDDCAAEEITAAQMLVDGVEGFSSTDETYVYNGEILTKIRYEGTEYAEGLYEQAQAVTWSPGNDSAADNDIVRTFDSITYSLYYTVGDSRNKETEETETEEAAAEETAEEETENGAALLAEEEEQTLHLWMEAVLYHSSDEAEFVTSSMVYYSVEEAEVDGQPVQTLKGYWEIENKPGTMMRTVTVKVHGMKNGDLIKPEFKAWIGGNETNEANPPSCAARIITVSGAARYNILVMRNSDLAYTSYFNTETGEEASAADMQAYKDALENGEETPSGIIYGTILGYGITVELYNDRNKNIMGIELPADSLEFDLRIDGSLYLDGEQLTQDGEPLSWMPYVWAYKENENTAYGTDVNNTNYSVNMNWNDEDDITKTTQYAWDGAPFNSGGGTSSCYSGGNWYASQAESSETEKYVKLHFRVSGYGFDSSSYPNNTSDGNASVFNSSYVKPFSAGYLQVIFPLDENEITQALENADGTNKTGYLEINMNNIVSNLQVVSVTGQEPESTEKGIGVMQDYFGTEEDADGIPAYQKQAVHEMEYEDNYLKFSTGLYRWGGGGNADMINKTNYFNTEKNETLTSSKGTGSTPIGSTVYIGADVHFSSQIIDTSDETDPEHYIPEDEFDPQTDNLLEYNYMTAMNLLQKFDADAYTPVGSDAVINQRFEPKSTVNTFGTDNAFRVVTTETATEWSQKQPYQTQSYTLTILYGAKPDGSNWKKDDGYSGGGEDDMDAHAEEDLIYFATLQDLYDYFGYTTDEDGNEVPAGKCVAILYQFRDCCIRTGRRISVTSRMHVTSEFEKTGETFCTTNDVRCWSTYRPVYKENYRTGTLSSVLYSFNWCDVEHSVENGVTAYGSGDGTLPEAYAQQKLSTYCYYPGYRKTEYEHGSKMDGTHAGGWYYGNTLLLYTLDSSISIKNTDLEKNSNNVKDYYYISRGERIANFEIAPLVQASSETKNFELVMNGSQATEVEITLELPEHLNYIPGSITFDYTVKDCGYVDGDLAWEVTETPTLDENGNETGGTTIIIKTSVTDVEKVLPHIKYACVIGTPGASTDNDAKTGVPLTTKVTINTTYEETSRIACTSKTDEVSIIPIRETDDSIFKEVGNTLTELGDELVYYLNYTNRSTDEQDVVLCDVLPYNGDGRSTSFSGGYQLTEVQILFTSESTMNSYLKAGGTLAYAAGKTIPDTDSARNAMLDEAAAWEQAAAPVVGTVMSGSSEVWALTYDLTSAGLVQKASARSALALYAVLPDIAAYDSVQIRITLSPQSGGQLITDGEAIQQGNDVYWNNFFYRSGYESVLSGRVFIRTAERTINGRAWLDQDQDGKYVVGSSAFPSTDELLKGIDVSLYVKAASDRRFQLNEDGTWSPKEDSDIADKTLRLQSVTIDGAVCIPAYDVLGNPVKKTETDESGAYTFTKLAEGRYYVLFTDEDEDYTVVDTGTQPLPFERLSVTPVRDLQTYATQSASRTDKAEPVYLEEDSTQTGAAPLAYAQITNGDNGIVLPALNQIQLGHYVTNRWNCGLYYVDVTVEKQWTNLTQVPQGNEVVLTLEASVGSPAVEYEAVSCQMTQTGTSLEEVTLSAEGKGVPSTMPSSPVVTSDKEMLTICWTVEKVPMQAEGAGGKITYTFLETARVTDEQGNTSLLEGYLMETEQETAEKLGKVTYTAKNRKILYAFEITKRSESERSDDGYRLLSGAEFTLYRDPECTQLLTDESETTIFGGNGTAISGTDGIASFQRLEKGVYYMKETKAPAGYSLNKGIFQIEIEDEGENAAVDDPLITVTLLTDEKTGETLEEPISVVFTKEFHEVIGETIGFVISFEVTDEAIPPLPLTGGPGTDSYMIGGLLLSILAVSILLLYNQKKRRRGDMASS